MSSIRAVGGRPMIPTTTTTAAAGIQRSGEVDWREYALCAQTDPEAFFPDRGDSGEQAKRVCADCQRRRLQRGQAPRRTAAQDAEIARRTAAGQSAPQIAQALDLTVRSVHRARARCSSQS